jgi:hypothetical protein
MVHACHSRGTAGFRDPLVILGALAVVLAPGLQAAAGTPIALREAAEAGRCTQVRIDLAADGLFRPALPPGDVAQEATLPKPLGLDVKTRLIFNERLLGSGAPDAKAGARRQNAVRWVRQAASAINGEVRPTAAVLRPDLSLLVAERNPDTGAVVVVSPVGPLTRSELELVQGLGDPLTLADLLPPGEVEPGQSWKLPAPAALALSGYDSMKSSTLEATLERADAGLAVLRIKGEVEGAALGGSGKITCDGTAHFDRAAGLVSRLELTRKENRQAGPVEAGLEVRSTLRVRRGPAASPAELTDSALKEFPLDTGPQRQLLQLVSPDGKYNLLHDRRWHTYWDDPKLVVLKRLEGGQVIAQLNLAAGPPAAKGHHQDPARFRDDIKRSLKDRFVQFLGAGEVDGDPAGGFRYKVCVQGRQGELGVIWDYYLIASPGGDQLLATFTLAEQDAKAFGEQDAQIIGSLQWYAPAQEGTTAKP